MKFDQTRSNLLHESPHITNFTGLYLRSQAVVFLCKNDEQLG
ncbi:hypothetical protein ACL6C3_03650 [Capilliphycus salinus ALCB114379]